MFKDLIIYRIAQTWAPDLQTVEDALIKASFAPCGPTQEKSTGWVPPRGEEHGALVESVGGQWIARFMTEAKQIPSDVLKRKVDEKAARIEHETGRRPGRKESKELKEEARLDLLPMAFSKQASTWVWIDQAARLLVIDSSSQGRADEIVSALVEPLRKPECLHQIAEPAASGADALRVIAGWPITDPANMDAMNMAEVARAALASTAAQPPAGWVMVDAIKLRQLRNSVHGVFYMGDVWEKRTVDEMLAPAPRSEP
ncbi:MAG: recombination-associated protein RdgC [Acidovorax sp.]|nr:recombination-associated protein RdgC [Acidovorax sp.]